MAFCFSKTSVNVRYLHPSTTLRVTVCLSVAEDCLFSESYN